MCTLQLAFLAHLAILPFPGKCTGYVKSGTKEEISLVFLAQPVSLQNWPRRKLQTDLSPSKQLLPEETKMLNFWIWIQKWETYDSRSVREADFLLRIPPAWVQTISTEHRDNCAYSAGWQIGKRKKRKDKRGHIEAPNVCTTALLMLVGVLQTGNDP